MGATDSHAMALVSFAQRLSDLAAADPDFPAVTCGGRTVYAGRARGAGQPARPRARTAPASGSATWSRSRCRTRSTGSSRSSRCWKVGAMPQPVSARLPARELAADRRARRSEGGLRRRARQPAGHVACRSATSRRRLDDGPLPDAISPAWKAPTSGGSTGRPKLIVSGDPSVLDADGAAGAAAHARRLHGDARPAVPQRPAVWSCQALLRGQPRRGARRASTPRRRSPRSSTTAPTSSTSCPR